MLAGEVGIEPTHHGVKVRCLTAWLFPSVNMMVEGVGFEPTKAKPADLQSAPFGHFGIPPLYGGAKRIRTADPLLARQVLSQLSYSPI